MDEGKFVKKNIDLTKKTQAYYNDVIRGQGCVELKNILVMTVDGEGKVYLQEKGKKYKTLRLDWAEKLW